MSRRVYPITIAQCMTKSVNLASSIAKTRKIIGRTLLNDFWELCNKLKILTKKKRWKTKHNRWQPKKKKNSRCASNLIWKILFCHNFCFCSIFLRHEPIFNHHNQKTTTNTAKQIYFLFWRKKTQRTHVLLFFFFS